MSSNPSLDAFLSIFDLCKDDKTPESVLIERLESIIRSDPTIVRERGDILLNHAVHRRSIDFVQLLVEADGGLDWVRVINARGLPFHRACAKCNVEVAKYLHSLYPESVKVPNIQGHCALHLVLRTKRDNEEDLEELTRFLLLNDQGVISTRDGLGFLPLHIACEYQELSIVKLIYNANPEAVHEQIIARDAEFVTEFTAELRLEHPAHQNALDIARFFSSSERIFFLESQLELERQSREVTQPDRNGLPIHHMLRTSEPLLGTLKLMAAANPASLTTTDNEGCIPLHIAFQIGRLDIVKYLIEANDESLRVHMTSGYLPLHLVCLGGNYNVVNYILDRSDHGVSFRIHGQLPIELLLLSDIANCDRNSLEYIEAVGRLLRANPEAVNAWGVTHDGCHIQLF